MGGWGRREPEGAVLGWQPGLERAGWGGGVPGPGTPPPPASPAAAEPGLAPRPAPQSSSLQSGAVPGAKEPVCGGHLPWAARRPRDPRPAAARCPLLRFRASNPGSRDPRPSRRPCAEPAWCLAPPGGRSAHPHPTLRARDRGGLSVGADHFCNNYRLLSSSLSSSLAR